MTANTYNERVSASRKAAAWLELGRAPFLSVGVLPYVLGAALGAAAAGRWDWLTAALGLAVVVAIMLTTYLWGEYADYAGDAYGATHGKNRFSGGSLVVQRGILGRRAPLIGGAVTAAAAVALGLFIVFARAGGWPALAMGTFGAACGFFYSVRPFRWVDRGVGEVLIAVCYGWLPVAVGFWLQARNLAPAVHWLAPPIALTIFNVIFINEFPDYEADRTHAKRNLVVRIGKVRSAVVYGIVNFAAAVLVIVATWRMGWPSGAYAVAALPAFLAFINGARVIDGHYKDAAKLEKICGVGILINLLMAGAFLVNLFVYGYPR